MQSVSIPLDYMIVARIDEGEDILNSVKQLVVEHKVQAGMFTLIGAVDRAEYGFYIPENKAYTTHVWEPSPNTSPVLEIVACLGNVAQSKGEPIIHAHITFTGVNGEVIGGHLVEGCRVNPTAELTLIKGTGTLRRKIVEKYQLALLEF